nr:mitotic catastrophe suppressor 4 [Hypsizygus marmoreus]
MNAPKLPALRLPRNGGECVTPDGVTIELPPSNKFSVSWPSETHPTMTPPASERANLSFSEADSETSDGDSGNERRDSSDQHDTQETMPTVRLKHQRSETLRPPPFPRFSRALSMPLPSQLGYLRNPYRSDPSSPPKEPLSTPITPDSSPDSSRLHELSIELADSVQMMIQTMLQITPPQLLDSAKEQFSACSLSVPTPSMSAMLTSMKNLNYISANMAGLCSERQTPLVDPSDVNAPPPVAPAIHTDFDLGEMLQSIGDSLSGAAAQSEVDLVLYHGDDIGLRHVLVRGDESGISYVLSHVVRQVLGTAEPGDSIVLGLLIGPLDTKAGSQAPSPDDEFPPSSVGLESEDPLSCTIRISHRYGTASLLPNDNDPSIPCRPRPTFSTLLLRRLLHHIGATLTPDLPPPKLFPDGRSCDFTLMLERGALSVTNTPIIGQLADEDPGPGEPSVEQLTLFAEGLKGKRVTLYANAKGPFAQHLTSYLTAWGMDLTHVSLDGEVDGLVDVPPSPAISAMPPPAGLPPTYFSLKTEASSSGSCNKAGSADPSFIFIDDDVEVLKERLHVLRAGHPYPLNLNPRKRPSLAARPRSSPQIARTLGQTQSVHLSPTAIIVVHFTSLANFKKIKDIIQSVLASHAGSTAPLPEVMIIPKPVGPRRFLTALHTAVTKPLVDPFFQAIATSPVSPGVHPNGSFFHSYHIPESKKTPANVNTNLRPSPKTNRPAGSRSNSDRSTKSSAKDLIDLSTQPHPPSPLAMSDNVEYFSEAATQLGASPSSGLVIQSPDGQPAGIFFHPRGKTQRNPSSQSMERDKGHLFVSPSTLQGRRSSSRLSSGGPDSSMQAISFSSLHSAAVSPSLAVEAWTAASPSVRAAARKPTSPRIEDGAKQSQGASSSSAAGTSSSSPPRRSTAMGEAGRKPTPSGSPRVENVPAATPRTGAPRRAMLENSTSASPSVSGSASKNKKGKASADGHIVPPISVLIVDDNPINQTILSTFMKKKKIKYEVASNGQEAVQKWRSGGFHLILMDIQMPIMDGIQATKEIRRLEQTNAAAGYPPGTPSDEQRSPLRTPSDTSSTDATRSTSTSSPYRSSVIIVALTASSLQSDRVAALAAGCNDFLTKPVSLLWLNNKIIEWGSIKALQMWADLRPDAMSNMVSEQAAQARNVADRLHVPQGRNTPSPSRPGSGDSQPLAGTPGNMGVMSVSSTTFWSRDRPDGPPAAFWGHLEGPSPPPSTKTLNEFAQDLAQGGRHGSSASPISLNAVASAMEASDTLQSPDSTPDEEDDLRHSTPSQSDGAFPVPVPVPR